VLLIFIFNFFWFLDAVTTTARSIGTPKRTAARLITKPRVASSSSRAIH
jgi:hypothetical protein